MSGTASYVAQYSAGSGLVEFSFRFQAGFYDFSVVDDRGMMRDEWQIEIVRPGAGLVGCGEYRSRANNQIPWADAPVVYYPKTSYCWSAMMRAQSIPLTGKIEIYRPPPIDLDAPAGSGGWGEVVGSVDYEDVDVNHIRFFVPLTLLEAAPGFQYYTWHTTYGWSDAVADLRTSTVVA